MGTCLGGYEKARVVTEKVHIIIQNDLLPHTDQPGVEGDREGKIRELLEKQNGSHLSEEDRQNLFTLITKYNKAFIFRERRVRKDSRPSSPY